MIDTKADPNDAYVTFAGAAVGAVVISIPIRREKKKKQKNILY